MNKFIALSAACALFAAVGTVHAADAAAGYEADQDDFDPTPATTVTEPQPPPSPQPELDAETEAEARSVRGRLCTDGQIDRKVRRDTTVLQQADSDACDTRPPSTGHRSIDQGN